MTKYAGSELGVVKVPRLATTAVALRYGARRVSTSSVPITETKSPTSKGTSRYGSCGNGLSGVAGAPGGFMVKMYTRLPASFGSRGRLISGHCGWWWPAEPAVGGGPPGAGSH